jgi:hypothetical protein
LIALPRELVLQSLTPHNRLMKEMTDGDLARYLYNHLVYEVDMLRHAYRRLGTFKDGRDLSMALECMQGR